MTKYEVLCIWLYTTSSFTCFNEPLHQGTMRHPISLSVYCLNEGLKKLWSVEAILDPKGYMDTKDLYRGMKNIAIDEETFMTKGGTELAPMSTTSDLKVSAKYAESGAPMLFQYKTQANSRGINISEFSVYPKEKEFLYLPLTLIVPQGKHTVGSATIYLVMPQMS